MSAVFLKVLNMSITASWLILAVVVARLLMKKAPKWIACLLWAVVALRLIFPFSFESVLSLIPSIETIPPDIATLPKPAIDSGITIINKTINPIIKDSFSPNPVANVNPLQIVIDIASIIWVAGIVALLSYALISYLRLKKTVSASVAIRDRIMVCDEVKAPFILGVFRPRIYVPSSMGGETLEYVIDHEQAHLQRRDHWWKPLGYLLLTIYWFSPLCWVAYILLCRDIEMACDEKVIRDMDKDKVAAYSQALLDCGRSRRVIAVCPLAFGEVGVKERVKAALSYKKPLFWVVIVAVIACIVLAVCFLTNPVSSSQPTVAATDEIKQSSEIPASSPAQPQETGSNQDVKVAPSKPVTYLDTLRKKYPEYFDLSTAKGLEVYVWQMSQNSYSCGVLPGTNRIKSNVEIYGLKGISIRDMKAILSTYNIPEIDIVVISFRHPFSSYWYEVDDTYTNRVRAMLFSDIAVTTRVAYANWSNDSRIITECLNPDMLTVGSFRHLPVYKFNTEEELDDFKATFQNILTMDSRYDEVPSFNEVTNRYDDNFFSEHTLILAYVEAGSGSYRYDIRDISVEGSTFCLNVTRVDKNEDGTCDMAGWFVIAEVLDSDIKDCTNFDAQMVP
ncbi:MAG: hypothetical protein GX900_05930 [Clostridiaceae bacterium]|nr:hypothetical protein [Clostridiaceae bacterium]